MRKMTKRIISLLLTVCLLFLATVPVFAADEDEEYLCDLRLIYADDFDEATEILADSDLEGYKIFNANLNANTGKKGVYLAYQTTTDIEDAITDISVMQMNGGYNEGNYQEMIKQSLEEYKKMGENYLAAIDYFREGYEAGNYLSDLAFRQLNFYNVVTEGIDEIPDFEGERLGDIFYDGIDVNDLATIFMQGNSYALQNLRSLLAMGVSYNADGKTYLEKVGDEAEKYNADNSIYDNEDYSELAAMIAPTIVIFRDMFKELEAREVDINWEDDEISDLELEYMETKLMAEMMSDVDYLGSKTLYQFCLDYVLNQNDYSDLYPLVAALNDGQVAMAKVAHYYDVVRYSMTLSESEEIETELAAMEEKYSETPFNVYTGVDRSIYYGTFALTSEAYRQDAFTESGLSASLFGDRNGTINKAMKIVGYVGAGIVGAGLALHGYTKISVSRALTAYNNEYTKKITDFGFENLGYVDGYRESFDNVGDAVNKMFDNALLRSNEKADDFAGYTIQQKLEYLDDYFLKNENAPYADLYSIVEDKQSEFIGKNATLDNASNKLEAAHNFSATSMKFVYGMYIVGGLMALSSAIKLGYEIYNYYHPEYTDIPTAMVDLIDTKDGDRYIKYDVVYEAEPQADGTLIAGDLNAFEANRWNALYFTKSYEAGKPLLADEFVISNTSNVPGEKHAPVHRFGEVVCYNLNKYNFNDDHSIYLSVKQSDNQKAAIADLPEIVGSVFSVGYYFLAGGVGIVAGVGGTIGTLEIIKRRKNKTNTEAESTDQAS